MFLKQLELKNFRNYKNLKVNFKSNITLITGKNAQGKTNLLEAIQYLASLASTRAKTENEMILWDKNFTSICGTLEKATSEFELDIIISPPKRKTLKVNGVNKNKASEFINFLSVVSFSVNDLLLLRGAPDDRRDWLDLAISQIYPAYIDRLQKYNKIKTQKNNFLKEIKGNLQAPTDLLDVLNLQLAISGSNILFLRLKFLKELLALAQVKHSEIAQNEILTIVYNSKVLGDFDILNNEIPSVEEISKIFEQKLETRKMEEIIRAQSLVGPHRDDISFFINNIEAKKFASQGQQRTIVLSLKLSELLLIETKINEKPLLLLDDVLAELDDIRQGYLLDAIGSQTQTIITSVDTLQFKESYLEKVDILKIKSGELLTN